MPSICQRSSASSRSKRFGGLRGDPGVEALAFRWPQLRVTAVLLSNLSGGDSETWPLVVEAVEAEAPARGGRLGS